MKYLCPRILWIPFNEVLYLAALYFANHERLLDTSLHAKHI